LARRSKSATRIKGLRGKLSQGEFAKRVGVPRSKISEYEGGKKPSIEMLLNLGNFAVKEKRFPDALFFFEEAGVWRGAFPPVTSEILKGRVASGGPDQIRFVKPTSKIDQDAGSSPIQFPASLVSNPEKTFYVRVSDRFFAPLFEPGDALVIDESETDVAKLEGACVAIYDPGNPVEVDVTVGGGDKAIRQTVSHSYGHKGVYAAWLLRDEKNEELTVSTPSRHGAIFRDHLGISGDLFAAGAIILGRVIAWIPCSDREQREQEPKKK
jgi:transcriptional regulator with XRE-family HTH domain